MDKSDKLNPAALSRGRAAWQCRLVGAGLVGAMMAVLAGPAGAATQPMAPDPTMAFGDLSTLRLGHYACEIPGDVGSVAAIAQPAFDFDVAHSSSYRTDSGEGSYLVVNGNVTLTNGPLAGLRFRRITPNFLRRLNDDGSEGRMRCVRRVRNNQ